MTDQTIVIAILYLTYCSLEIIPVARLAFVRSANPYQISPADNFLWISQPISTITTGYLFLSRLLKWAFLIYFGYFLKEGWYLALILAIASIPVSVVVSNIIEKIIHPSKAVTIILPILPILITTVYLSIIMV